MKIKHTEIVIDAANPFANCKLNRVPYARILTNIVGSYADGFVLAINNEWGTGKTTFVKMWQQQLTINQFQTLYFNAWENDFESNPLVAIMSELKTLSNKDNDQYYKSLLKKGAVITKNILPALVKGIAEKYIDIKAVNELLENASKAATEILEKDIEEYADRKQKLLEFRVELENFIKESNTEKPIIFIIDELDRCKPNYAVEVLEQIKHFFSVKGIVFVLAIDKVQLGHAVRGVYGSEQINSEEYLRRFIDLEYSIPAPTTADFCNYLFMYYDFQAFFFSEKRKHHSVFHYDQTEFLDFAILMCRKHQISLRQQEKLFAHTRLVLNLFKHDNYIFPSTLFLLVYVKMHRADISKKIESRQLSVQQLSDCFYELTNGYAKESARAALYTEAELLTMYNNSFKSDLQETIFVYITNSDHSSSPIVSKSSDQNDFANALREVGSKSETRRTSLEYLIKKINLLESIA